MNLQLIRFSTVLYFFYFGFCLNAQHSNESDFHASKRINTSPSRFELFYGQLFLDVQRNHLFPDQKTFVDAIPKYHPDTIVHRYLNEKIRTDFDLRDFVNQNFSFAGRDTVQMIHHLNFLWNDLTRESKFQNPYTTLISLPYPYIVPGGRFGEIFYWDSYFTMLGLAVSNRSDMIENMVRNFAYLIDTYGHIPNGNRSYFLSRSQPPFFALMVELLVETKSDSAYYAEFLPQLLKEYSYWQTPARNLEIEPGKFLTRYWDDLSIPRPEAWAHSEKFFLESKRDSSYFRDERAACESGWDFSSRWFADTLSMKTMNTTDLVQVDLNTLLYELENRIALSYQLIGNTPESKKFSVLANSRKNLILKYCWNSKTGFFHDYNVVRNEVSPHLTLAGVFPLFSQIATAAQASSVSQVLETKFLYPGGLVTTLIPSREQWDFPNGWAPLQWIGYQGLMNYEEISLANQIAQNWTSLNIKVYLETGKMMEKYNVVDLDKPGGGGEYDAQDGFGWTNGVFLSLWDKLNKLNKE